MANIGNPTATTTEPSTTTTASTAQSLKWTMRLKLKAAHRALALLGVTNAMIAEADLDKWAKIYELLVGAPPPKKPN